MSDSINNAMKSLNLPTGATPNEIRNAYLSLVRQHPPDRDADKFREIHSAYQLLSDPMLQAESILATRKIPPNLQEVIATAAKIRPRLSTSNLLALGNLEGSTNERKDSE
jgi:curved DNA-binding protein CbpA